MTSIGIIYGACGNPEQLDYATRSARSAKQVMPNVPRHLWTSFDGPYDGVFDKVVRCPESKDFLPRMLAALETPFDRTLVIDNDTRVVSDCTSVFSLLDHFDIAAAHAPMRKFGIPTYPEGFAAFNCGVILFRRTPEVMKFFSDWIEEYKLQQPVSAVVAVDQLLFAEMLYRSSLRICTLPPEYNLRTIFPMFVGGRASVKLVHGKEPELTLWEERFRRLGRTEQPQLFQRSDLSSVSVKPVVKPVVKSQLVLGIGLSRTGTHSLNDALQILGYPSVHFPMSHSEFSVAATDTPMALGYAYLDLMHPGSKFILTVRRRVDEWLDSCEWLWTNKVLKEENPAVRDFHQKLHRVLYGGDFERGRFREAYFRHVDGVMRYFKGRDKDLLVMDITEGDGWDKLCPFLEKPIPGNKFPRNAERPSKQISGGTRRVDVVDDVMESATPRLVGINRVYGLIELIESVPDFHDLKVLELGSYDGVSTVEFLRRCRSVHAVDRKIRPGLLSRTACYGDRFTYTESNSVQFMDQWLKEGKPKFDLVYIDTSHEFQHTCNEISRALKIIRPAGWVTGHDYAYEGAGGTPLNDRGVMRAVQAMLGYPDRVFRDTSWLVRVG